MENKDSISVKEDLIIGAGINLPDILRLRGKFTLEVFREKKSGRVLVPELCQEFENGITNVGGQHFLDAFIGAGSLTAFNNANAHIGVGNGTTAFAVGQTDLQGASKTRKAMESTFPSRSGQVVTFRSLFGTGDANYAWEEMAIFNASSSGTMGARALVGSPFTKTSALSITANHTLTCP